MLGGLKHALQSREVRWLLLISVIGVGLVNPVTTWIEDILRPRGFSITQAGIAGGLMIAGGIVGVMRMPAFAGRLRRRAPVSVLSLGGALPAVIGIAFATQTWLRLLAASVPAFFRLSAWPIGFPWGAEITRPTPEGTWDGLLPLIGQTSPASLSSSAWTR